MTVENNHIMTRLVGRLLQRLSEEEFAVQADSGRVRRSGATYFIPDVFVVPMEAVRPSHRRADYLESVRRASPAGSRHLVPLDG